METSRLLLEPIVVDHAAKLFDLFQDDQLCFISRPRTLSDLEARYEKFARHGPNDGKQVWLNWAARCKMTGAYLGWFQASLYDDGSAGLSYVIFPMHWRKGYGAEGCKEMMTHLTKIYEPTLFIAEMDCQNLASVALAEKLGFTRVENGSSTTEFRYELICL